MAEIAEKLEEQSMDNSRGWGHGQLVDQNFISRIYGRIVTIIEALELNDKREKAIKNLIGDAIFKDEERVIYIDEGLHEAIRNETQFQKRKAELGNEPMGFVGLKDLIK